MITDAAASAAANLKPTTPASSMKPSGLISGEEVRNAITGPHGRAVVISPMTTAIVPHAQSGVNAPTATLVKIETLGFANRVLFSFSVSICTFNIEAVNMARLKGIQLWTMLVKTVEAISASKPGKSEKFFPYSHPSFRINRSIMMTIELRKGRKIDR